VLVPVGQTQLVPTGTGKGQKRPLLVPWDKLYTHAGGLSLSRDKLYTHDGFTCPNLSHKVGLQETLIEMWIICLDPVSANSEKGRGSEWAVRVGQRLPSKFVQSGAAREMNLVQIVCVTSAMVRS